MSSPAIRMPGLSFLPARRLPWPLPALLAWGLAWMCLFGGQGLGLPPAAALSLAAGVPVLLAWRERGLWRRVLIVLGFPVSWAAAGGGAAWPPWAWLLMLAPLLAAYPLRAWRDAPFFPTPRQALDGLPRCLHLPESPRMLDAGCGAGHGLMALALGWPGARLHGTEWSWPLVLLARWRCRGRARIARGDLWADDWSGYDLVYLFQRPESMARAWAKAQAEMRPGSWLVSLEFQVPDVRPTVSLAHPGMRTVHAWRLGDSFVTQSRRRRADIPRRPGAAKRGPA